MSQAQASQEAAVNTRNWIKKGGEYEPEDGRYHLYVAYPCPWASRTLAMYYLKGLEDSVGLSITSPVTQLTKPGVDEHAGWVFAQNGEVLQNKKGKGKFVFDNLIPDTNYNLKTIRDLYELGKAKAPYSVPVLWDKKTKTIVNNESSEIIRIFNSELNEFAKNPKQDFYPENLRAAIDEINAWTLPEINMAPYKAGFAQSQEAYDQAAETAYKGLDKLEDILSKNRYAVGDSLTETDIRLYVTLIRFDSSIAFDFKLNQKFIKDYPNIREYLKELYNIPGIKKSTNIDQIKIATANMVNDYGIYSKKGPEPWWEQPSSRV